MAKNKKKEPLTAKKQPGGRVAPIHTEILVRPMHRGINDIGTWRGALRLADLDNRTKLYDLYTDLLIDGYLSDAIDKRIDAVTDADLSFTINGKAPDLMIDLMDTPEFENLLREIMLSRFWGVSLDECYFIDGFNFKSIPRKHIRTKTKEIALREEDRNGIDYSANDCIIQFGADDDYGILLRAAPYVIYKRGGFGDWSQFVELFGMPQRIGKYSSMDEQSRRALIQAFEEAGSAPYLVIPKETEATQTTLSNSGNGALYNDFRNACNEEILITILGQTMTTQDGSSLAQGQVHLAVQEKKHRADRRFVERMLNKYFVPLLEKRGYPVSGGKFKFLDKAQELSVADTVQLSAILPIPQSFLYNKYNIPIPEGDEAVAGREPEPVPIDLPDDPEDDPKDTDKKDIKNADRNWLIRLRDFFVGAPQAGATGGKARIRLSDDTLENRIINQVADCRGEAYFNPELFRYFADQFVNAVQTGVNHPIHLADTGFVYGTRDDAFITAMEMNVFHFSAAKTLAELQELNSLFRDSTSFEDFYKKATATTDVFNKRWQKTEYETAVLTAESASNYQQLIGSTKLFPYWMYRTVGDGNVRPEHAALDGLILPANDPRWDKIFPPNGWKCRCRVVPLMAHEVKDVDFTEMQKRCDDYFGTKEWKTVVAQHWGSNRGKRSEVFDKNQMYIRKFPDVAAKMMEKVPLARWGVTPSLKKRIAESGEEIPFYEGDPADWWEEHKTVDAAGLEVLSVTDYNGRDWFMSRADYDTHTTNRKKKREFRTGYLSCLSTILSDPDEVWLGQEYKDRDNSESQLTNYILIKYYKDKALACSCKLENGKQMKLKTWFEVRDPKIRKGLLLKVKK